MSPDRRWDVAPDLAELELKHERERARLIRDEWQAVQRRAEVGAVLLGGVLVGCLIASVFVLDEPQASGVATAAAASIVGGMMAGAISGLAFLLGLRRVRDSVLPRGAVLMLPLARVLVASVAGLVLYLFTKMFLLDESFVAEGYRPQAFFFIAFLSGLIAPRLLLVRVAVFDVRSFETRDRAL
jgi:hypothetical protein